MSDAFKRYVNTLPKVLNPENSRVMYALLYAIATVDDEVQGQVEEAKKQLFVRTATGKNLDRLAASLGVERPPTLGLTDEEFQNLIPNLSLKHKSIRKAFYDTADVFWGPLFSRSNITTRNVAPFNIIAGDQISVIIDRGDVQIVKVLSGDIATSGAATAEEVKTILSKIQGVTVEIRVDSLTGDESLNVRTNTPGPTGGISVLQSSMIGTSKLDFTVGDFNILNLDQRVAIYNVNPNELLIEIPSIVPALRRTLKGSHHFHADSTLVDDDETNPWVGSFLFNPSGDVNTFTITRQSANLIQSISKGQVYTSIAVDSTVKFENPIGELIFDFGKATQEGPVKYRGIPNTNTILLDPGYVFKGDHSVGATLNVISKKEPYVANKSGKDLAIYLTSPSGAREVVQTILTKLAAAGIIVNFKVLAPKYKYLIDNPYISDDDAPGEE